MGEAEDQRKRSEIFGNVIQKEEKIEFAIEVLKRVFLRVCI